MSARSIYLYPDLILRKPTKIIKRLSSYHHRVMRDLIEALRGQPGGIGIAAPQIGYPERIAVVDVRKKDPAKTLHNLINPVILSKSEEKIGREGCMSLPDFTGNVRRAQKIKIAWRDEFFCERQMETEGIEAICIQHEVDHLDGFLFIDKVASMDRDVFRRKKYL